MAVSPVRLNHAVLFVADLDRAERFYTGVFGMEVVALWMLPRDDWGAFENSAPVERLDLDAEIDRWSGVRTAGL